MASATTRIGAGSGDLGIRVDFSKTETVQGQTGSFIRVNAGQQNASGAYDSYDMISGFGALRGTKYADNIVGDSDDNYLDGSDGNDTIFGGAGNDTLAGGKGTNAMEG